MTKRKYNFQEHCHHKRLVPILSLEAEKQIGHKRQSFFWCATCGSVKHIDLDGIERFGSPTYKRLCFTRSLEGLEVIKRK